MWGDVGTLGGNSKARPIRMYTGDSLAIYEGCNNGPVLGAGSEQFLVNDRNVVSGDCRYVFAGITGDFGHFCAICRYLVLSSGGRLELRMVAKCSRDASRVITSHSHPK